jgi:hypothetical protein
MLPVRVDIWNWYSSVIVVMGYEVDGQGTEVQFLIGQKIFSSLKHSDWFWGKTGIISSEYCRFFPWR